MNKLLKIVIGMVVTFVVLIIVMFFLTSGMVDTADSFFTAVKQKDIAKARSFLSEDFKASTDENSLKEFLSKGAILNYKEASWSNRQTSGGQGELNGSITTESGGVVPIKLMFVKESGDWKIYAIQKPTAGLQSQDSSPMAPNAADQIALVKKSIHDFAVSANNKSMEHFWNSVSKAWQRQFSKEKFDQVFGGAYPAAKYLMSLESFEPKIEGVPQVGDKGELILKGHILAYPNKTRFEQKYIYEGLGWKLIGFSLNNE